MSEPQATYETDAGRVAAGPDVAVVSLRGMTEEERESFWQDVQNYENRCKARRLYRKYKEQYGTDGRAFEEAAEHLPFGWRQVKRIVKGY